MPAERFDFLNKRGEKLSAVLDRPAGTARATALFAHCFTCGKDNKAARRIAEALNASGIAVLRFDFTGLGSSEGEFANTHFSSNVEDLVAAAAHLQERGYAPSLLIGHSLGGAAVLSAASEIPEARAVVTIAAPSDPGHVAHLFRDQIPLIREQGEIEVSLAGRPFRIRREFLDDIASQSLKEKIAHLRKALLVFHSPTDEIVGIDNATAIFVTAKHPKSFVSLAGADHLLSRREDAAYVATMIAPSAISKRPWRSSCHRRKAKVSLSPRRGRENSSNSSMPAAMLSSPTSRFPQAGRIQGPILTTCCWPLSAPAHR